MQRDYDKAEQECQRYKTLYDVTKEEVCNFFWCEFPGVFSHFLSSVVFLVPMYIILLPLCVFVLCPHLYVSGYSISRRR